MRNAPAARAAMATLLVLTAVAIAGCAKGKTEPRITSAWPRADSERVVPKPPEPPRWPLSGMAAPDAATILRRVYSVKIENSPAARPQTGIQAADVVYESLAEGGISRFNAMYHSSLPAMIGPVRSARLSDTYVVPQYGAVFLYSGANKQVLRGIRRAKIQSMSEDAGGTGPFFRNRAKRAPHNLFIRSERLLPSLKARKWPTSKAIEPFLFERGRSDATPTITEISIPFSSANRVTWTYDAKTGRYLRVNNGAVHRDAVTGKQISARNVVVLWATTGRGMRGRYGSTLDIVLIGENKVAIFRGGRRYNGTWTAEAGSLPSFRGSKGRLIKLAPGNTWFQVVPGGVKISAR